jgi:hypothetical protein
MQKRKTAPPQTKERTMKVNLQYEKEPQAETFAELKEGDFFVREADVRNKSPKNLHIFMKLNEKEALHFEGTPSIHGPVYNKGLFALTPPSAIIKIPVKEITLTLEHKLDLLFYYESP